MGRFVGFAAAVLFLGCGDKSGGPTVEVLSAPAGAAGEVEPRLDERADGQAEALPSITVSAELKAKLVELAVVGECARREAVPTEQAIPRLEALFAAQGVTLAEYSDAMAQLVSDKDLHEAIAARLPTCGALVEALWPKSAADAVDAAGAEVAEVSADGDTSAGAVDAGPAVQPDAGPVADTRPDELKDVQSEVRVADTAGPSDIASARDVEDKSDTKVEPKPAPSWSGTWVGPLKGAQSGNLRVTVSGRVVTGAVATFGRSTIRLKGSLSDKGSLTLGGTVGDEFVRLSGRIDRAGQAITGTWDGVVARKRSSGSFRLSR